MWRFILSLAATIGLIWLLSVSLNIGGTVLPPLGKFMSPSHGFWKNAENNKFFNTIHRFDDVQRDIEIVLDSRHVPHVFASSDEDPTGGLGGANDPSRETTGRIVVSRR